MMPPMDESESDRVPVFGTWRAIYTAVIVVNVIVMALVYAFSRFAY